MTGEKVHVGLCAVVVANGVELILTSRRVMPFDADHLRVLGIEPAERRIVVTKAAVVGRAAFGDIAEHAIAVDSPGVCTCILATLPYERVAQPIAPLDEITDCEAAASGSAGSQRGGRLPTRPT
ncbi:MAG: MlrC C-terminal domain-containing protein [Actinomycetia bacterium]|nr:MlrC C-terminal domain-containing protein [Actinomycetes bacterium]